MGGGGAIFAPILLSHQIEPDYLFLVIIQCAEFYTHMIFADTFNQSIRYDQCFLAGIQTKPQGEYLPHLYVMDGKCTEAQTGFGEILNNHIVRPFTSFDVASREGRIFPIVCAFFEEHHETVSTITPYLYRFVDVAYFGAGHRFAAATFFAADYGFIFAVGVNLFRAQFITRQVGCGGGLHVVSSLIKVFGLIWPGELHRASSDLPQRIERSLPPQPNPKIMKPDRIGTIAAFIRPASLGSYRRTNRRKVR
jgi:hypothetical protein